MTSSILIRSLQTPPVQFTSGVTNLQHACHTWHGKQFPMACKAPNFTYECC